MATKYRVEYRGKNREWIQVPTLHETITAAELFAIGNMGSRQTRVVPVDEMDIKKITAEEAFKKFG